MMEKKLQWIGKKYLGYRLSNDSEVLEVDYGPYTKYGDEIYHGVRLRVNYLKRANLYELERITRNIHDYYNVDVLVYSSLDKREDSFRIYWWND